MWSVISIPAASESDQLFMFKKKFATVEFAHAEFSKNINFSIDILDSRAKSIIFTVSPYDNPFILFESIKFIKCLSKIKKDTKN